MGDADRVAFEERPVGAHVNLRGDPRLAAFLEGVRAVLGFDLPTQANTVASGGGRVACWLGPDEWLLMGPEGDRGTLAPRLQEALAGIHAAATEVSGGQAVVFLPGAEGRDVLSGDCPLDLDPRVLPVGHCAQTRYGKVPILVRPLESGVEVVVKRSFFNYLRGKVEAG